LILKGERLAWFSLSVIPISGIHFCKIARNTHVLKVFHFLSSIAHLRSISPTITHTDPKKAKNEWRIDYVFCTFDTERVKAARKMLVKLKPRFHVFYWCQGAISPTCLKQLLRKQIPKVQKDSQIISGFFVLLRSLSIKARCKILVILTPGVNFTNILLAAFL